MLIYRLILLFSLPALVVFLLWKSVQAKQFRFFYQRFAIGLNQFDLNTFKENSENCLWFHCASVGEVNTALPLIEQLKKMYPKLVFIITTNTATGALIVARHNRDYVLHNYLPIDIPFFVKRFIEKIRPMALCVIETELWPNLYQNCQWKNIPVFIINGRLSSKTMDSNHWLKNLHRETLKYLHTVYTRSEQDTLNFVRLGATLDKVVTMGNIKYSPHMIDLTRSQELTHRDYIVAASTHDDEELQIATVWKKLQRNELLVIAIRHPERSESVQAQLAPLFKHIAVRSKGDDINDDTEVFLLDTVGELTTWYSKCKVVIMGGSFSNIGGHNILEPAFFSRAIIYGPHMQNFEQESKLLLKHEAALQAQNYEELEIHLASVLDNSTVRKQLEINSGLAVAPYEDIVVKYAEALEEQLGIQ